MGNGHLMARAPLPWAAARCARDREDINKAKKIAAHLMEAPADADTRSEDGKFACCRYGYIRGPG